MAVDLTGWVAVHDLKRTEQTAVTTAIAGLSYQDGIKVDTKGTPVALNLGADEDDWRVSPDFLEKVRSAQPAASTAPASPGR